MDPKKIIEKYNELGNVWHKLHFPNGMILNGEVDMNKFLQYYNIPSDLTGKTVLDVGCATGFFAFEFYKRGAKRVVAIDTDYSLIEIQQGANKLMNTNVEFLQKDLLTLESDFGKFDLVFCSNLLQHISDHITAIRKLRLVTRERAIICTHVLNDQRFNDDEVSFFYGGTGKSSLGIEYGTYFFPTLKCLKKILLFAKFDLVENENIFELINEKASPLATDGVIHGVVNTV